jgi:hypothetical protein
MVSLSKRREMARPKKEIPSDAESEIEKVEKELEIWGPLLTLVFDVDNIKILLFLRAADEANMSMPFSRLGERTKIGKSQRLVDSLNYLTRYGLVQMNKGGYRLTPGLGRSVADFVHRMIKLSDKIGNLRWLKSFKEDVEEAERAESEMKKEITKTKLVSR